MELERGFVYFSDLRHVFSKNRRYDPGHEKRNKKQRLEAAAQTQRGALDTYVLKES
jgi:hypothetical protein